MGVQRTRILMVLYVCPRTNTRMGRLDGGPSPSEGCSHGRGVLLVGELAQVPHYLRDDFPRGYLHHT